MSSPVHQNPRGIIQVIQIINFSLVFGVVAFLGFAILTTQDQPPQEPRMTYLALGFLAVGIIISLVFRVPINKHPLMKIAQSQEFNPHSDEVFLALAPTYQTERIIRLAIIEGGAFFNVITYMQEKVWWSLAATGLAILLMLIGFPTRGTIDAWIERRTLGFRFGDSEF